jgi:hypothetical protein
MPNQEHLWILGRGVKLWNQWRREHPEIIPDLSMIELSRQRLTGVNFARANLAKARMQGCILSLSNLEQANLSGAFLFGALLSGANLRQTNLESTNLIEANFNQSSLRGANLANALLYETNFANVDLSEAAGLNSCEHLRPSTLDHRTLTRSGPLPLEFLRGCGLPDLLINIIPTLQSDLSRFYSCFISHSSKDAEVVRRVYTNLQTSGVRCWYAPEDLPIGAKIRSTIDQAIGRHDKLLLVLSHTSVTSQWVEQEVEKALERERTENRLVLFPIRIDDTVFSAPAGWANTLKNTRNIGDFTDWGNPDAYARGMRRLLRDLRAASATDETLTV